mmetsp:Transcript_2006/g.2978  ORF Transcript_2006/g.2978 Transcript_2006/m.2978 type:complete len:104 (+) Transcript_2006:124-435(+)
MLDCKFTKHSKRNINGYGLKTRYGVDRYIVPFSTTIAMGLDRYRPSQVTVTTLNHTTSRGIVREACSCALWSNCAGSLGLSLSILKKSMALGCHSITYQICNS